MKNWIETNKDKKHIAIEKTRARELRKSPWWKNEIAKGVCHYCGKNFPSNELTMDHIVPISRGGKSTKSNVVTCCKECNNKKNYLTPADIVLENMKTKN